MFAEDDKVCELFAREHAESSDSRLQDLMQRLQMSLRRMVIMTKEVRWKVGLAFVFLMSKYS